MRPAVDEPAVDGSAALAAPELAGLRVLIVHEWLYTWAGAERCLEQLVALMPHAHVLAGIITPRMRGAHDIARRAEESWVGRLPGARAHHRWFLPAHALAFAARDTRDYDLVISVSHAFEKAVRATRPGALHLSYCLSPPRYLWDLSASHDRFANPVQRMALRASRAALRAADLRAARGVHRFVSLSRFVAERVRRIYGRASEVVYPPVSPKASVPRAAREPFLLTVGRLVPYKRVDLAIAAAERLGLRLLVAGDGPERERLRQQAGPHVEFLGEISEVEAAGLLERCAAFVFCAEEDFGIAPVEANAHGAPVVAFARGGVVETQRESETAVFFHEHEVSAVATAIERCLAHPWNDGVLRDNARRFAPSRFRDGMREQIARAREVAE